MSAAAPSRALARLDAAIAAARHPMEQACLQAERAGLLARQGRFEPAQAALDALRAQPDLLHHPVIAAWLCLAEGLLGFFRGMGPAARDRIRRAHALSSAVRTRPLIALSAAWLAQAEFSAGDFHAMTRHVTEALQEADDQQQAARACACLVAAQAYHWAGRLDLAQPFYERARQHALNQGDEATIGALLIHRAWISGQHVVLASLLGAPAGADPDSVRQALLSADSAGSFEEHVGKRSQRSVVPLLKARLRALQGDFADALGLYEANLQAGVNDGLAPLKPVFLADMAWCRLQLGRIEEARSGACAAQAGLGADSVHDTRALGHLRLSRVWAGLGDASVSELHAAHGGAAAQALREQQQAVAAQLGTALSQVPGLAGAGPGRRTR